MVILLKLASVVSPLGKTLCWKRLCVKPKRIAHSVSPAMFHQVTFRFGYLYAYAERHGNRHTHPYVFFFHLYSSDTSVCCLILPRAFLRLSLCPFSFQSINSNIRPATSCVSFYKVPISSVCGFSFYRNVPSAVSRACQGLLIC